MLTVAIGVLLAVAIIVAIYVLLSALVLGYVLLWHGIDHYGPLKDWWLDRREK